MNRHNARILLARYRRTAAGTGAALAVLALLLWTGGIVAYVVLLGFSTAAGFWIGLSVSRDRYASERSRLLRELLSAKQEVGALAVTNQRMWQQRERATQSVAAAEARNLRLRTEIDEMKRAGGGQDDLRSIAGLAEPEEATDA